MFDLLLLGRWLPAQVRCAWAASMFAPTPATEQQIEAAWVKARERPGVNLFDGAQCRLEGVTPDGGNLLLRLSHTNYKAFVGTNMVRLSAGEPVDASQLANPVGLSVALESVDGRLLLGRRNDRVAYYPAHVHPFAGTLEPGGGEVPEYQHHGRGDRATNFSRPDAHPGNLVSSADNIDVFADALRELREELSLETADVTAVSLVAIVADAVLRQPELIFVAKTRLDSAAIRRQIDPAEHREVVAIAPADLDAALTDTSTWTPVAVAAAMLFGREKLGAEWFFEMLKRMGIATPPT